MKTEKHIVASKVLPLFAVVAMLFGSCEKVIQFDPGDISPYVVMISKPENDSLMTVYIGYSRFFLDNGRFGSIDNASVSVSVGDVTYSGIYDSTCFQIPEYYDYYDYYKYGGDNYYGGYRFSLRPKIGDTLRVLAHVPGHDGDVSAVTVVPHQVQVEIMDYICDTTERSRYGETSYKIRIKIKSNSSKEYYNLSIYTADVLWIDDTTRIWDTTSFYKKYFSVNDPIVNSLSVGDALDGYDGSFYGNTLEFSSEMFSGGEHEFTLEFENWNGYYTHSYLTEEIPVRLYIKSLSEDLHKYNTTSSGYSSDIDNLFSEPVQVYCNIEGGIGILGASTSRVITMPSPRFEHFTHN